MDNYHPTVDYTSEEQQRQELYDQQQQQSKPESGFLDYNNFGEQCSPIMKHLPPPPPHEIQVPDLDSWNLPPSQFNNDNNKNLLDHAQFQREQQQPLLPRNHIPHLQRSTSSTVTENGSATRSTRGTTAAATTTLTLTRHRSYQHLTSPPPPLSTRLHQRNATVIVDSFYDRNSITTTTSQQISSTASAGTGTNSGGGSAAAVLGSSAIHHHLPHHHPHQHHRPPHHQIPKLPTLPHTSLTNSRSHPNLNGANQAASLQSNNNTNNNNTVPGDNPSIVKSEYSSYPSSSSTTAGTNFTTCSNSHSHSHSHFPNIGTGHPSSTSPPGSIGGGTDPHSQFQRQPSSTSTSSTGISSPLDTIPSPLTPLSQSGGIPSSFHTTTAPTKNSTSKSCRSKSETNDPNEPDEDAESDRPWDLVPYHVPWGPSYFGYRTGTIPGPEGQSLFLRSPIPIKHQRTSQACEKCRERKAKCSGTRPSCSRCIARGHMCEYSASSGSGSGLGHERDHPPRKLHSSCSSTDTSRSGDARSEVDSIRSDTLLGAGAGFGIGPSRRRSTRGAARERASVPNLRLTASYSSPVPGVSRKLRASSNHSASSSLSGPPIQPQDTVSQSVFSDPSQNSTPNGSNGSIALPISISIPPFPGGTNGGPATSDPRSPLLRTRASLSLKIPPHISSFVGSPIPEHPNQTTTQATHRHHPGVSQIQSSDSDTPVSATPPPLSGLEPDYPNPNEYGFRDDRYGSSLGQDLDVNMDADSTTAGPSTAVFLHHPQPTVDSNSMLKALSAASSPLSQEIHADELADEVTPGNDAIKPDPEGQFTSHPPFDTLSLQSYDERDFGHFPVSPDTTDFGMDEQRTYDYGYSPDYGLGGYSNPNSRGLRYSTSMPHLSTHSPHVPRSPEDSMQPPSQSNERMREVNSMTGNYGYSEMQSFMPPPLPPPHALFSHVVSFDESR